jgi:hypothetical protein
MHSQEWLAVTNGQALRFFFEHLRDVTENSDRLHPELLYNASVLAHFATTSTASVPQFPSCPSDLATVFEVFVLDRSQHADPEIMEAAAAQCLLLTGFFEGQVRRRHNVKWYATLGANFYDQAGQLSSDRARAQMMSTMAERFEFWRRQQSRLAKELRDLPRLLFRNGSDATSVH